MRVLLALATTVAVATAVAHDTLLPASASVVVGDLRITALSPTLVRLEPRGPRGFENRSTFNVVGRDGFSGLPIRVLNSSAAAGTWLATAAYLVHLPPSSGGEPSDQCKPMADTDAVRGTRHPKFPNGTSAADAAACCALCMPEADCVGWTYHPKGKGQGEGGAQRSEINCWPFLAVEGTQQKSNRIFGYMHGGGPSMTQAFITTPSGQLLWNGTNLGNASRVPSNMLHWPSPMGGPRAYAFEDAPRFTVPAWGPTPIPAGVKLPPELQATNGYDFGNDVAGDTYVFLLGDSLDAWWQSRGELLQLTGPTPLLPDFAFGIWYTWYIMYTEQRAKDEIGNWTRIKLPLDVWALDMNWRHTGVNDTAGSVAYCRSQANNDPGCRDHFYHYENLDLMPGLDPAGNEWFRFLKQQQLRTYFNDHPFPLDNQTSPREVNFRYKGISEWIGRGLSYFWFDHNWAFTVPGPLQPFNTKADYKGLSGQVWGSHIYYEATKGAYAEYNITDRPIALSRDNGPNWRTPDPVQQTVVGAGSPAHHRFPVWWTGDGVPLLASVESMVNEAVHDFRSYVHSDCGGHGSGGHSQLPPANQSEGTPNDAALLRWTAHCVLGTVVRFHQGDHRFWLRDNATQDTARMYLNLRYKLAPSLIAAGRTVQSQGFPLTARCDLLWPEHAEARDSTQYLHLNATLVAPLDVEPVDKVESTRSVWVPPGEWVDGWSGATVTGPRSMTVTQPPERIPMWHKRGSVLVTDNTRENLRIVNQDWSVLTVEAFPASEARSETRTLYEQDTAALQAGKDPATRVTLATDGNETVTLSVSESPTTRSWLVRLHLRRPDQRLRLTDATMSAAGIDGGVHHLAPTCDPGYFPLMGAGSRPPCQGGTVAEFRLGPSSSARHVIGTLETTKPF